MSTPPDPIGNRRFLIKLAAAITLSLVVGSVVLAVVLAVVSDGDDALANADPGRTEERLYEWAGPIPQFTDVTELWGLDDWRNTSDRNASGGAALADLDGDGLLDIVLAGGRPAVYFASRSGFTRAAGRLPVLAVAVTAGDIDGDGILDLVFGGDGKNDLIVWGGSWLASRDLDEAETAELAGGEPTTGVLIADLSGDGLPDILRLGYGGSRATADVIYEQAASRQFDANPLPNSDRRSLAAEIADLSGSGTRDIWVTRDIGWQDGGDSIYRLQGEEWVDIAADVGADLAIDGMGVTLADLTGDALLDAYLSDLGDNEFLQGISGRGFSARPNSGANRIRPPGAKESLISSTWATGVADLNLDGLVDLVAVNGGFAERGAANKVAGTSIAEEDPPAIFLGLGDGRFADVWDQLGLEWRGLGRGLSLGDLDADGDVDLVITTRDEGLTVLRNDSGLMGFPIRFADSCDVAGAEVEIKTTAGTYRLLASPHTFLGHHAPELIVAGEVLTAQLQLVEDSEASRILAIGGEEPGFTFTCR